jgi:hypothetical protein
MRKLFLTFVVLIFAILGAAIYYVYQFGFAIYLTEEELQQRVEEPFPIEQRHMTILTLTLSDPRVNLVEGSERLHYEMRARASILGAGEVVNARARISGTVRYDSGEGAFFFDDFRIEELDTGRIPGAQREWVRDGLAIALREALRRQPVYRLQRDDFRQLAAWLALRDVRVVDQRLRLRLGVGRESSAGESTP